MISMGAQALRTCGLSADEIETKCLILRPRLRAWQRGVSVPKAWQKEILRPWIPVEWWDVEVPNAPEPERWPPRQRYGKNHTPKRIVITGGGSNNGD